MLTYLERLQKLQEAFPKGRFTKEGDFLTYPRLLIGFSPDGTMEDLTSKVLEWLSRPAFKSEPYRTKAANDKLHKYHLDGINSFCETSFTEADIEEIYTYLGNHVDHEKTLRFIRSGYDMAALTASKVE